MPQIKMSKACGERRSNGRGGGGGVEMTFNFALPLRCRREMMMLTQSLLALVSAPRRRIYLHTAVANPAPGCVRRTRDLSPAVTKLCAPLAVGNFMAKCRNRNQRPLRLRICKIALN